MCFFRLECRENHRHYGPARCKSPCPRPTSLTLVDISGRSLCVMGWACQRRRGSAKDSWRCGSEWDTRFKPLQKDPTEDILIDFFYFSIIQWNNEQQKKHLSKRPRGPTHWRRWGMETRGASPSQRLGSNAEGFLGFFFTLPTHEMSTNN